uniref:Uncharacterized protein n=1 Tax=Anopheles atroparvus TaxID=41427 RepID=A0AAG5DTY3_ANOAO
MSSSQPLPSVGKSSCYCLKPAQRSRYRGANNATLRLSRGSIIPSNLSVRYRGFTADNATAHWSTFLFFFLISKGRSTDT